MATLSVTAPPNTQNIVSTVTISAPLARVFEAHTNKELLAKWWARGNKMQIDEFTAKPGGRWRYREITSDGTDYYFNGVFHEIITNQRIIQTFEYEGMPEGGHVALESAVFSEPESGKTQIVITTTFQNIADRDGMVSSGMEQGFGLSVQALGKLLNEAV